MKHFILVYHRKVGLLGHLELDGDDPRAYGTYCLFECAHVHDQDIEVVMLGADSFDDLKRTHGNYFASGPLEYMGDVNRALATVNKHVGSSFEDFLREEGVLQQTDGAVLKRVEREAERRGAERMREACLQKVLMASEMTTARLVGRGMGTNDGKERERAIAGLIRALEVEAVLDADDDEE